MSKQAGRDYIQLSVKSGHPALDELDRYCDEQGGVSRSDAMRSIFIAWYESRTGQQPATMQSRPAPSPARTQRPVTSNAATADLDF